VVGTAREDSLGKIKLVGTDIEIEIDLETGEVLDTEVVQDCYYNQSQTCELSDSHVCYLAHPNKIGPPRFIDDEKKKLVLFIPDKKKPELNVHTDESDEPTGLTP